MTQPCFDRLWLVPWLSSSFSPLSCFSVGILHTMEKQSRIKYQLVLDQEVELLNSALECCFPGVPFTDWIKEFSQERLVEFFSLEEGGRCVCLRGSLLTCHVAETNPITTVPCRKQAQACGAHITAGLLPAQGSFNSRWPVGNLSPVLLPLGHFSTFWA